MLKSIIRTLLQKFIDDIDSDNCNITMEQHGSIRFWALKIGMSHTTLNYRLKTHGEDNLIQFIKSKLK